MSESVVLFGRRIPVAKTIWMALQSVKGLGPTLSLQVRHAGRHGGLTRGCERAERRQPLARPSTQVCESLGYSKELKLSEISVTGEERCFATGRPASEHPLGPVQG